MLDLTGVFVPSTTPFHAQTGDVDLVGLRSHLQYLMASDLAGVVLFGSTGEGLLLDEGERIAALEAVREIVGERMVLAGAAAESTRTTVRMARDAASAGADAILVAPPAYYRPQMTPEALREHYVAVADGSPIPVLLYQVPPAYSGIELKAGLVAELARHPNIVGIKDSTGDLQVLGAIIETCDPSFAVLVGSGTVLYGALEVGACGGIVAIANLAPSECGRIFRLRAEGQATEAGAIQERLAPLHRSVVAAYGVPGVKAALDLQGLAGGPPRSPLRPLRDRDIQVVREALDRAGVLEQAPQSVGAREVAP